MRGHNFMVDYRGPFKGSGAVGVRAADEFILPVGQFQLLTLGARRGQPWEGEPASSTLCDWLGDCAEQVRTLFNVGERLAREHVGWDFLKSQHI
jgi:hypothetical protein